MVSCGERKRRKSGSDRITHKERPFHSFFKKGVMVNSRTGSRRINAATKDKKTWRKHNQGKRQDPKKKGRNRDKATSPDRARHL